MNSNYKNHFMNTLLNTFKVTLVILAMVTFVAGPQLAQASLLDGAGLPGFGSLDLLGSLDLTGGTLDSVGSNTGGDSYSSNIVFKKCSLKTNFNEIITGGSVTLTWDVSGFSGVTINGESVSGEQGSKTFSNILVNTTYVIEASDGNDKCRTSVSIVCLPPPVITECKLEVTKAVDKATAKVGDELTYTIVVKNIGTADCTGDGVRIEDAIQNHIQYQRFTITPNITAGYGSTPVYQESTRTLLFNGHVLTPGESGTIRWVGTVTAPTQCGDFEVTNQARATARELNNFGTYVHSQIVKTTIDNDCVTPVAPNCESFTATPGTVTTGTPVTLAWTTVNANRVAINNGIGDVPVNGSISVTPLATLTYTLTVFGANNQTDDCMITVNVSADPVPVCESFTATPAALPSGGGTTTLAWVVTGANSVTISPTVGMVGLTGSQSLFVNTNTNYTLTATDNNGDTVTCPAPVTVQPPTNPEVLTCENNVTFTASPNNIDEGDSATLTWNTTGIDSVAISIINATGLSGTQNVSPNSDTTYVLTATRGTQSVDCPITIVVDEDNGGGGGGGGGGGSSSPRCELTVSDQTIQRGEEITLTWETSRATAVTIEDNRGNVIVTTDGVPARDKDELYDGEITLTPTRDTTYTINAARGSRDRECSVEVEVEDDTVLLQARDQQPLVAGISLTDVPYTGFEAGPILTLFFYMLLMAWALYVTYLIVIRQRAAVPAMIQYTEPKITATHDFMKHAEQTRPDLFVATVAPVAPVVAQAAATYPSNLPTETVIGYANYANTPAEQVPVTDEVVTMLENRAHAQKALLSSDAVQYFISTTTGTVERNEALDDVIAEAKKSYPLEDGWIVINEARMQNLCEVCTVAATNVSTTSFVPTMVPAGSSSLAEAIVTGNIVAAYEMIGNRPMFALADAAADLDSVYRNRRGEQHVVSDLLTTETAKLSDEKIKNMIDALTGAIDGTYTDEASAVKMSIMKAVKEVA
jgi:uncharacterized repeat protein (TIGR01451 family)